MAEEMTMAEYRDLMDRRYRGESVAFNAEEAARIRKRAAAAGLGDVRAEPHWLLVMPDGTIDGCHTFQRGACDTEEAAWKRFEARTAIRQQMIAAGWTVRRDEPDHSGRRRLHETILKETP